MAIHRAASFPRIDIVGINPPKSKALALPAALPPIALWTCLDNLGQMDKQGAWYTVDEVAQHLRVSPALVYKLISRKGLPGHKVGRQWRFHQPEVDAWVKSGRAGADAGDQA